MASKSQLLLTHRTFSESNTFAEENEDMPPWLFQDYECYVMSLSESALSVSEMQPTASSLNLSHLRLKTDLVDGLVNDFCRERTQILEKLTYSTKPWTVSVSRHFQNRYGDLLSYAFRDVRVPNHFSNINCDCSDRGCCNLNVYGETWTWLVKVLKSLTTTMSLISKDDSDVLHALLQSIPCHLRPSYNRRSVCSCRSVLLLHIHCRIFYLASLPQRIFFEVFFSASVSPFHTDFLLTRTTMTEQILSVEYGDFIIYKFKISSQSTGTRKERKHLENSFHSFNRKKNDEKKNDPEPGTGAPRRY
jgi:hypothetical protein